MTDQLRILRQTTAMCLAELRAVYTWRTWLFGWLLRVIAQVAFYTLVGRAAGTEDAVRFILIGNIAVLPCLEATIVVVSVTNERMTGTLPLLVIAPANPVAVYLGRGVQWLVTGFASSAITLLVAPPLLGLPLPFPRLLGVLPLLFLIGLSSYCYACFLAGLSFRWVGLEFVLVNVGYLVVMAFCGVNVPATFWPWEIRLCADVLPVTHGLVAVRALLAGAPSGAVLASAADEALVGAAWLAVAALSFHRVLARGRRDAVWELST